VASAALWSGGDAAAHWLLDDEQPGQSERDLERRLTPEQALADLKRLRDLGLITDEDYEQGRSQIIRNLAEDVRGR
jgi:DNA-binding transcriptional ArsR family regulator